MTEVIGYWEDRAKSLEDELAQCAADLAEAATVLRQMGLHRIADVFRASSLRANSRVEELLKRAPIKKHELEQVP